ncbi:MAG TPA: TIGR03663 family protein [Anaerohalosphaeraceae bacterium]|nr:TIGR03663 family protein [Anaerohalosphaeraceae bacterium]
MKRSFYLGCALLAAAAAVRFPFLSIRPMHTDEAVHAVKLGHLLETGLYKYEPLEYHGPTLYYFTWLGARLAGIRSLEGLSENLLRGITALAGLGVVLTPWLTAPYIGKRAAFFASVLLAFSPAFVYYSGYFIHEIWLVLFLGFFLGGLCRYWEKPRLGWAVWTGLSAGLMFATKETAVLSFVSAALAFLFLWGRSLGHERSIRLLDAAVGSGVFLLVWLLFFSGFGTHWQGLFDSLRSLWLYPSHAAVKTAHFHPWWYYLDLLTWTEFFEPVVWNEDGIVALALLGSLIVLRNQRKSSVFSGASFLVLFTLILTICYSVIPYKTPWNVLPLLYGMVLPAGLAADRFLRWARGRKEHLIGLTLLLLFGLVSPLAQSLLLMTRYTTSPSNPYVYGHTSSDIFSMFQKVQQIAKDSGQGRRLYIQVFAENDDYWPWPWYLRSFPSVGYFSEVDPSISAAALILADARLEPEILKYLYETPPPGQRPLYLPLFDAPVYLRPSLEWRGYIRKDLLDLMQAGESAPETKRAR